VTTIPKWLPKEISGVRFTLASKKVLAFLLRITECHDKSEEQNFITAKNEFSLCQYVLAIRVRFFSGLIVVPGKAGYAF
jgi:hypothetical protein